MESDSLLISSFHLTKPDIYLFRAHGFKPLNVTAVIRDLGKQKPQPSSSPSSSPWRSSRMNPITCQMMLVRKTCLSRHSSFQILLQKELRVPRQED